MKLHNLLIALCFLFLSAPVFSQSSTQTNFTISPPPLGYPEYPAESSVTQTLNMTGAFIKGDTVSIKGFYMGWIPRYGTDWMALDGLLGLFVLSGDIDTSYGKQSLSVVGFNLAPAVELPVINSDIIKLIIFAGYDLSYSRTTFATTDPFSAGNKLTWYLGTTQHGPIAGIQCHLIFADSFMISPFFLMKTARGSVDISTDPAYTVLQTSYDLESYTVTTYGFDIIETGSGITLSGLIQMTGKTNDTEEIKTYTFGASMKI
jgi:hypothetical protein